MKLKGVEFGVAELALLLNQTADKETLELHYKSLHPDALTPLLEVVANYHCQTIMIYFENLALIVANQLYRAATCNPTVQKIELDLGVLLAFMSKKELDYGNASDIAELFHSKIYQKVHTLIIDYPEMTLTQAHLITEGIKVSCATEETNLQKLMIICPNLSKKIKDHWQLQLKPCRNVVTTFYESSANLCMTINIPALPEEMTAPTFAEVNETNCFNVSECLASLLTWVWGRSQAIEPVHEERTYYGRPSYHRKSS